METFLKWLITPSNFILSCLILGALLLTNKKLRKYGVMAFALSMMFYIIFGNGPVSFWLLRNLEQRYPGPRTTIGLERVKTIVVLSGNAEDNPLLPVSSRVNVSSAFRVIEALRLFRELPNARILIVGGEGVPVIMETLLVSLGVDAEKISIEENSQNTYENAIEVQKKVEDIPFILVTSAAHMPRAAGVFHKMGLNPIPAPTDYKCPMEYRASAYLPSPTYLEYSNFAVHEYIGIIWYWWKDRL